MNCTRSEKRLHLATVLLVLGLLLSACGSKGVETQAQRPSAQGSSTDAAQPAGQPGGGSTAGQPAQPAQPSATRPTLSASAILSSLDEAQWQFARLRAQLPDVEERYQARNGEETTETEYAYDGGRLRVIVSDRDDQVIALLFDTRNTSYQEAAAWQSSDRRLVKVKAPYVAVVRTRLLDQARFSALVGHTSSLDQMVKELGEPSYRVHLHGVGFMEYYYLPQGLVWFGGDSLRLSGDKAAEPGADKSVVPPYAYADYQKKAAALWDSFAGGLIGHIAHFDRMLTDGMPSPDGRFRATLDRHGGYWGEWLIIRQEGKAEQRYNPTYFVSGYEWLDASTLVYLKNEGTGNGFYTIDALQRKMGLTATVNDEIQKWGVLSDRHIWYAGKDGVRHDLRIP